MTPSTASSPPPPPAPSSPTRARRSRSPRAVDEVVVLDYGGQYSQLIARRVRECGVFSELLPHHVGAEEVARRKPKGLILSGGPGVGVRRRARRSSTASCSSSGSRCSASATACSCSRSSSAGRVEGAEVGEFGRSQLTVHEPRPAARRACRPSRRCWMSHRDTVFEAPPGFTRAGVVDASRRSRRSRTIERGVYGIQFHPEVVHTPYGQDVLKRFLGDVCGCDMTWSAASIVEEQIARIRAQVGDGQVICGLSRRRRLVGRRAARPPRGRRPADLRVRRPRPDAQERGRAGRRRRSATHFHVPLVAVDAEDRFLDRLRGVTDPEAKRKIIGAEFIRVFEEEAAEARRRALPRAGHALLRRDRVRRRHRRGDDQVPPQRRRPARGPRVRARRAAARAVQGRGPRASAPSSGCPSGSSGASRSRARAWRSASSAARRPRSASTSCATPTPSCRTRSARPASTASCGSPSACCPTCAPSACRATSAPTATWS